MKNPRGNSRHGGGTQLNVLIMKKTITPDSCSIILPEVTYITSEDCVLLRVFIVKFDVISRFYSGPAPYRILREVLSGIFHTFVNTIL